MHVIQCVVTVPFVKQFYRNFSQNPSVPFQRELQSKLDTLLMWIACLNMLVIPLLSNIVPPPTHPVDQLPHHAGPAAVGLRGPVQPVVHQLDLKGELQGAGQLSEHVHTEALVLVVSLEVLVVGPPHHVRVLLPEEVTSSAADSGGGTSCSETQLYIMTDYQYCGHD